MDYAHNCTVHFCAGTTLYIVFFFPASVTLGALLQSIIASVIYDHSCYTLPCILLRTQACVYTIVLAVCMANSARAFSNSVLSFFYVASTDTVIVGTPKELDCCGDKEGLRKSHGLHPDDEES